MVRFAVYINEKKIIVFFFSSGVDAVKDKVDEKKSEVSKESNKNAAENEAKSLVETVKEKAAEAYVTILCFVFVSIYRISIFRYTYVAGGEGDKGLVGT